MPPKTTDLKRYLEQDIRAHHQAGDVWLSYKGVVYDVSSFVADHPGGDDVLLPWAGLDITSVMADGEHQHSKLAYEILAPFAIGRVVHPLTTVYDEWKYDNSFNPDDTDIKQDLEQTQFLDLSEPLIPQMWRNTFSKSFYLEQVHQPRHLPYSAKLFPYGFLEVFTLTPWWFVPSFWLPIAFTFFFLSALQFSPETSTLTLRQVAESIVERDSLLPLPALQGVAWTGICWVVGVFLWTLLEYFFHRCVFHLDAKMPDKQIFLLLHFLMHGIHHFLPMDRMRLVMPPVLFFTLELPFTTLAHLILPRPVANGVISGAFTAYVCYDCLHYFFHHTKLPAAFQAQKSFHMQHHYRNFELGYGVTSKFWDVVFGTDYDDADPRKNTSS